MASESAPQARREALTDSWIRIGLVVAAFAPFLGTLFFGYVYDDSVIIVHNRILQGWTSVVEVWKHPYWVDGGPDTSGLYRPLLMTFFAILWNGARKYAIAFHLFAIVAHTAATLLLAKVLRHGVGKWPAAGAALWFAFHPVHVEAVANISNVSEVLVCVWTLLLVLWLYRYWDRAPRWAASTVAALIYAAALFTKESGGVAPGLALLTVICWRSPGALTRDELLDRLRRWRQPLGAFVVVLIGVLAVRRMVLGGVTGTTSMAVPGLAELGAMARAVAMLSTGGHVAQLLVWPMAQTPDYGPTSLSSDPARTFAACLTVLAILALLAWACQRAFRSSRADSRPLAAIGWCLIAYFPASNLLGATGPILAERTLYLASVGVALLVAWSLEQIAQLAPARIPARVSAGAVIVVVGVVCARGYEQTRDYSRIWRDHRSLFTRIVEADSLSYRGYQLLAIDAKNHGRADESARLYARAYALRPSDQTLLTDYGEYLLEMRRPRYALAIGERLLSHRAASTEPRAVTLYLNATGRVWGPDSVLAAASRLNAQAPSARAALFIGMAYDAKGDSVAARTAYRDGLRLAPRDSALAAHATPPSN